MTFEQLGIAPPILRAIQEKGFISPTPVQEAVIPLLITSDSQDLIALAQTGTGKTAAYGLPLLQSLNDTKGAPQAIILTPTRELCVQVTEDINTYAQYLPHAQAIAIYGGASIEVQIRNLRRQPSIVVATPGRLIDMLHRGALSLRNISTLVLDEADNMLDLGFRDELQEVLTLTEERKNLWLFSATMSSEVKCMAQEYLHNSQEIQVGGRNKANANIKHLYCTIPAHYKYQALKRVADYYPDIYGIVFCRTRMETKEVAEWLIRDGYNADTLHGDLSQAQRDMVMNRFRLGNIQLLVATDVAARGLDVDNLTHVIHYGLPDDIESYTHRSGRTARAGKTGHSIAICHLREKSKIKTLEKKIGAEIERFDLPTGIDICTKQLYHLTHKIEHTDPSATARHPELEAVLKDIHSQLSWIEKEDLIDRVMTLEFERLFGYYSSAAEIPTEDEKSSKKDRKQRSDRANKGESFSSEEGMTRLFINLGKKDKLYPNRLLELINQTVSGKIAVGKIDLMSTFSFFDVESDRAQEIVDELSMYEMNGREIIVDYADRGPAQNGKGQDKKKSKKKYTQQRRR